MLNNSAEVDLGEKIIVKKEAADDLRKVKS